MSHRDKEDDQMQPALWVGKEGKGRGNIRYARGNRNEDEVVERLRIRMAFPD